MPFPRVSLALAFTLMAAVCLRADVRLPAIFGDHMVLQRDGAVPVWGTAAPGETVTVTAGTAQGTVTAGADGKWMVRLSGLTTSAQPIDVEVAGRNRIAFHDVLVGDVWLCSGQSNMEFGIGNDASAREEIPLANHPEIRLFMAPKQAFPSPAADLAAPTPGSTEGQWLVCTPETVRQNGWDGFSAVGYYFGRDIAAFTHAPVGLVSLSWGGTSAQAWISQEGLQAAPSLQPYGQEAAYHRWNFAKQEEEYRTTALAKWQADVTAWKAANPGKPAAAGPAMPPDPGASPGISSVLFNGMIAPVIPYGIKGALWYQGESNTGRPVEYGAMLSALTADWRDRWGRGAFPFLIVQLPGCGPRQAAPSESPWAALRESQAKAAALPGNGLAVTIDLGEAADLHPKDKYDVSARLALAARRLVYGDNMTVSSGPTCSATFVEGGNLHVLFDNRGGGLTIGVPPPHFHPGEPRSPSPALKGFAIAGADGKYAWADARIAGAAVVLSSPQVPQPVSVRYDWADSPEGNLYNQEGLPAAPFRTDAAPVGELAPKPPAPPPSGP